MGIKDILTQLLRDRGVEVAALARDTGVARQAIADILTGKTGRPQNKTVKRIAEYFDIAPAELLGEGTKDRENDVSFLKRRLAELEKRLNGPAIHNVVVDKYQEERLIQKYFKGSIALIETQGISEKAFEELLRGLFLYDDLIRRADAKGSGERDEDS